MSMATSPLPHRVAAGRSRQRSRSHPRRARHARAALPQGPRSRARQDAPRRRACSRARTSSTCGSAGSRSRRFTVLARGLRRAMATYAARRAEQWRDGERLDVSREMAADARRRGQDALRRRRRARGPRDRRGARRGDRGVQPRRPPVRRAARALPIPTTLRFRRGRERLDATIYRLIYERRASGEDRGDLLSMLLLAQDSEGDGGGMSDRQLRDEAMTLFLAGHETTANLLAWTWYLLAQHPEAEAALHAEVDAVPAERLGADDRRSTAVHARRADGVHAPVPAGLDPRATCARAVPYRRHEVPARPSC